MVIEGFSNFLMVNVVPDFVAFLKVSKLGLGCMGLNGTHNSPLPEEDGIAVIKHAFDKGSLSLIPLMCMVDRILMKSWSERYIFSLFCSSLRMP